MDYSNPLLLAARTAGQRLGVLRPVVRAFRRVFKLHYEHGFDRYMLQRLRPGDTVWDVGANVGYFSQRFASLVAPTGRVVAFEPSSSTFAALERACAGLANVELHKIALADFDGEADFSVSESPTDPTNAIASSASTGRTTKVDVRRADSLVREKRIPLPNRIKIDVEGFELDVLSGMSNVLSHPQLRSLFIEVHFSLLRQRGLSDAPARITTLLKSKGFGLRWIDPSHVVAERSAG
jgi:FkbM family methyltransferase